MAFQVEYQNCTPELIHSVEQIIQDWREQQPEFTLHTSGSTGTPKPIRVTREQMEASAERSNAFFGLREDAVVLLCISPKFVGGMMVLIRALVGDYRVLVCNPNELEQLSTNGKFDFASLVPLQMDKLIHLQHALLSHIRVILLGGTGLTDKQCNIYQKQHSNCYIGFGMTETISHIALKPIREEAYTCLEGVKVSRHEERLVIQDSQLGIDRLETNDVITLLDERRFIWHGRADFTINSGGIKLHPEEMENVLREFIDGPFILTGIPDQELGEKCILLLDISATLERPFSELCELIRERFGKYAAPKEVLTNPFIFSDNGKILRKQIQKQLVDDASGSL